MPIEPMQSYEWWLLLGIPAALIALFLIYLARIALYGRYQAAPLSKITASAWLPHTLMEFGYWLYRGPVRAMIFVGITPDMLTIASLLLSAVGAVLIAKGVFGAGGWVLLLGYTCDVWDGMVARALGTGSDRGEFLDATIDRYCDLIGLFGFAYYYREQPAALVLTMAAITGSMLVSYTRAKGECMGIVAEVGYMRRYERAVWLGAGTVLAPLAAHYLEPHSARPQFHLALVVIALLAILGNITAVWRVHYILRELKRTRVLHAG